MTALIWPAVRKIPRSGGMIDWVPDGTGGGPKAIVKSKH